MAALLDTKGPEIRLKQFAGGKAHLKTGQTFTLTTREVEGSAEVCSITYKDLPGDLAVGSTVLLADGLISMTVTSFRHRHPVPGGQRRPHQQQQGRERAGRAPFDAIHEPAR